MVSRVEDIRWIVTDGEVEALILESNLIKEHSPRYNINLKDDKRYPYIKITVKEAFPRVLVTRRVSGDGSRYFGPYTAVKKMRASLKLIKKIFPVRSCRYDLPNDTPGRACLDYHIGKCNGPCIGRQTSEEYRQVIREVILFLSGKNQQIIRDLERRLEKAVERMDYESALKYRDRIGCLKTVQEKQKVLSVRGGDQDLVALCLDRSDVCGLVMKVRDGRLLGSRHIYLDNAEGHEESHVLSLFLTLYYQTEQDVADEILLPCPCDEVSLLADWFAGRGRKAPTFRVPRRGEKRKLVDLAMKNCRFLMAQLKVKRNSTSSRSGLALAEIRRYLGLEVVPRTLVCVDISEIAGCDAVGSLVRFDDGLPRKDEYRRFRIREVSGQDDVAMVREVLKRYLLRKAGIGDLPDLILLDGGKGQLSAGVDVLKGLDLEDIPIFALAKREEEVYRPDCGEPIRIPGESPALHILCRLRDEAHRFAIGYHRKIRSRHYKASILDDIPGIGSARKRELLRAFGSVARLQNASVQEISRIKGFSEGLSRRVKSHLDR